MPHYDREFSHLCRRGAAQHQNWPRESMSAGRLCGGRAISCVESTSRLASKNLDDRTLTRMQAALVNVADDISVVIEIQARQFHP